MAADPLGTPSAGAGPVDSRTLSTIGSRIVSTPGIRADALEKIFERFYTDRPHQGFGQNSGLGLSISKQIVEAHGGKIWAENRIGAEPSAEVRALCYRSAFFRAAQLGMNFLWTNVAFIDAAGTAPLQRRNPWIMPGHSIVRTGTPAASSARA